MNNMLLKNIFLLFLFILIFSSPVSANIGDRIIDILNYEIPAPAYVVDKEGGYSGLPFWVVILTFTLLFSIIWLASMQVPLFKPKENQGARKAFVIALAILTIFTTPVVKWILKLIKLFTVLTIIALLIAGVYTIYVLTRSNIAKNRKTNAESSENIAEARTIEASANRQNEQTNKYNRKTKQAVKKSLRHQLSTLNKIEEDMNSVLSSLNRLAPTLNNRHMASNSETNRIIKKLNDVSLELGKIISYKTNNDRLLSGMNTRNYIEEPNNTLVNVHEGTGPGDYRGRRIRVLQNIDTQTNDLGSALNGLLTIIRSDRIRHENISKLIDITLNALNIIQRMKRDIVLEEQMIEKI
ncbi:MAG: hypothetical protein KatS3mg002_0949 [Candidatus Woesearchaeota archaeon]|nr:MAG: hypothetical protein KatS3mg002_0949 [Candidatus Woesearchaeota archaeon]